MTSATSWACSPRRSACTASTRPSATGTGPASVSSISLIVSSSRFRAVTWSSSRSRSIALAAYPAYSVTRSSWSRCGGPMTGRNTVITPASPPGPSTGTDQELATLAALARPPNGAHAAPRCALAWMTGSPVAAARPTGPPAGPAGSRAQAAASGGGRPSEAAQTSPSSVARWMHSRSADSAAPSADRISDRLDDGSAETSRSASPCSRVSWPRADELTCWPEISARTSSGCASSGRRSPTTRPWRSTTMRSASRNIWSMSWQAIMIVVPCPCSRVISSSTCRDSCTPSEAVGSSRSSSCGSLIMARATASSWRWPPDSVRTLRVVSVRPMPSPASSSAALAWNRVPNSRWRRRSRPSSRFAATSRLSHSARSCQTTATPARAASAGPDPATRPASVIRPLLAAMSPAMQRTSVVLPAPFSPASATSSPGATVRFTPSSACTAPNRAASPDTRSSGSAGSDRAWGAALTCTLLTPAPGLVHCRRISSGHC